MARAFDVSIYLSAHQLYLKRIFYAAIVMSSVNVELELSRQKFFHSKVTDGNEIVVVENIFDPIFWIEDCSSGGLPDIQDRLLAIRNIGRWLQLQVPPQGLFPEPPNLLFS